MTIRYLKSAFAGADFAEASFAKQASQDDVAADIATATAAVLAAGVAAGLTKWDQRVDLDHQQTEGGVEVIRLRARMWA